MVKVWDSLEAKMPTMILKVPRLVFFFVILHRGTTLILKGLIGPLDHCY